MERLDELGMPEKAAPRGPTDGRRYEIDDERPSALIAIAGGLSAAILVGLAASLATLVLGAPQGAPPNPPPPTARDVLAFPEPRLQNFPAGELHELQAAQKTLLSGWGWIDPDGGIARIPVELAAQLYLAGGRPAASRPETRTASGPASRPETRRPR
jgi:hypothetical protein